jgi:hypothetical protein
MMIVHSAQAPPGVRRLGGADKAPSGGAPRAGRAARPADAAVIACDCSTCYFGGMRVACVNHVRRSVVGVGAHAAASSLCPPPRARPGAAPRGGRAARPLRAAASACDRGTIGLGWQGGGHGCSPSTNRLCDDPSLAWAHAAASSLCPPPRAHSGAAPRGGRAARPLRAAASACNRRTIEPPRAAQPSRAPDATRRSMQWLIAETAAAGRGCRTTCGGPCDRALRRAPKSERPPGSLATKAVGPRATESRRWRPPGGP